MHFSWHKITYLRALLNPVHLFLPTVKQCSFIWQGFIILEWFYRYLGFWRYFRRILHDCTRVVPAEIVRHAAVVPAHDDRHLTVLVRVPDIRVRNWIPKKFGGFVIWWWIVSCVLIGDWFWFPSILLVNIPVPKIPWSTLPGFHTCHHLLVNMNHDIICEP